MGLFRKEKNSILKAKKYGKCQKFLVEVNLKKDHNIKARTLSFLFQDWQFDDGNPPPSKIVDEWFNLLKSRFREEPGCCVAVHCVAGLGR